MRTQVDVTPYYYDLAEKVLRGKSDTEPTRKAIIKFCKSAMESSLNETALKVLGIDENGLTGIWWRLHGFWMKLGLPKYTGSAVDEKAVANAIETCGIDGITQSIENYSRISRGSDFYAVPQMEFDEFMVRGIEDFTDEANPVERYRRVNALALARELKPVKEMSKEISKIKFDASRIRKIRVWLDRRVERKVAGV